MKTKKIEVPYFLNNINNHSNIKEYYLEKIKSLPKNEYGNIFNTDWTIKTDINYSFFLDQIKEHLDHMKEVLRAKECIVDNIWFQQYVKNNFHGWHTHGQTNYTNVYFLELEDQEYKTEVYNVLSDKTININSSEGQLLSFPAFMLHRSPVIKKDIRKTIIAFNISFIK